MVFPRYGCVFDPGVFSWDWVFFLRAVIKI
jgi:hypothetical protein